MKVTILGSEGQIGAYLSEYLTKKGHEVTGVDVVYGPENDLRVTPSTYIESKIVKSPFEYAFANASSLRIGISVAGSSGSSLCLNALPLKSNVVVIALF